MQTVCCLCSVLRVACCMLCDVCCVFCVLCVVVRVVNDEHYMVASELVRFQVCCVFYDA